MSNCTKRFAAWAFFLFSFVFLSNAQTTSITGSVQDAQTRQPLPGIEVKLLDLVVITNPSGSFALSVPASGEQVVVSIGGGGYRTIEQVVRLEPGQTIDLGVLGMEPQESIDQIAGEEIIPTITLSIDDQESAGAQNISGVLTASRDVFISAAAFTFGPYRFNIRGYDSDHTQLLVNGVLMNDPESGGVFWSRWGGLNDVTRSQSNTVGLGIADYAFGGVGGASFIDTRAASQRKQMRFSYALSNRAYRQRLMGTWSSGLMPGGWAVSLSASRRWAEEGYVPGTFYDAWSYFLSVDKQMGRHTLNLTAFGAPVKRGRNGAAVQELYDLAGSNYYNPYWGFQNGEKRNSRVVNAHQPMVILRHDFSISENTRLTTAAGYQFGRYGSTAMDWFDARDPRPDYYRKLPSYIQDEQSALIADLLRTDESKRQIDWDYIYNVNYGQIPTTIENEGGIAGNTVTGRRAQYVIEDRRYDSRTASLNTILQSNIGDNFTLNGGLTYQYYQSQNFKVLEDLLGADFYLDIDRFAGFLANADDDFIQNDLDNPNRAVRQGDVFGYNYDLHVRKGNAWVQGDFSFKHLDLFLAGNVGSTTMWRDGQMRNGKFPDKSIGESKRENFLEYGAKAGVTYKIDGRNYLLLNGAYIGRAPFARNAFLSPRTRNDLVRDLTLEKVLSVEGGYLLRSPYAKARIMGYFTRFDDQVYNRSLFLDDFNEEVVLEDGQTLTEGFVNYTMNGVNTQHAGLELAGEVSVLSRLKISAVAAIGQHIYTNRPEANNVVVDVAAIPLAPRTIYLKNFRVANGPQSAYTLGLNYSGKDFWFANLNFNYFDNIWIDVYPERRTLAAVSYVDDPQYQQEVVDPDSELYSRIIDQEKAPAAFTMDFFGGKSWKIGDVFLYLNVGVNNILDKKDFITGGYEQFRFDFENKNVNLFPNRYFYSFGRNYFISLAFRM